MSEVASSTLGTLSGPFTLHAHLLARIQEHHATCSVMPVRCGPTHSRPQDSPPYVLHHGWQPGRWRSRCVRLRATPDPGGALPNTLFVPDSAHSEVLQWGHSSKLTCHPGLNRTMYLLRQRFWWPSMVRDMRAFVAACPVCACRKSSQRPPAGILCLLPVPWRPWSHIAVDFVTSLPPSNGYTVILTIVNLFSKAAHFIPLPKLPSAAETGDLLVRHVFRI